MINPRALDRRPRAHSRCRLPSASPWPNSGRTPSGDWPPPESKPSASGPWRRGRVKGRCERIQPIASGAMHCRLACRDLQNESGAVAGWHMACRPFLPRGDAPRQGSGKKSGRRPRTGRGNEGKEEAMRIQRVRAATIAEALKMARNELGDDAVILEARVARRSAGRPRAEILAAVDDHPCSITTFASASHAAHSSRARQAPSPGAHVSPAARSHDGVETPAGLRADHSAGDGPGCEVGARRASPRPQPRRRTVAKEPTTNSLHDAASDAGSPSKETIHPAKSAGANAEEAAR